MTSKRNKKMGMEEIIKAMLVNKRLRLSIVKRSLLFFFHYYFMGNDPDGMYYPLAPMHREMIHLAEDAATTMLVIAGFRGSGKSTILATTYPLWAILGEQKIKYILIISKTEAKSEMMLGLIKHELENNEILKKDCGPFREERGTWNTATIYLDRYNAKISVVSTEQSIRSFRHMQYRPQVVICDDLEDLESVKTYEAREKLHQWLLGDVIPATAEKSKVIVIGGILNQDSLIPRLKKSIDEGFMDGKYRIYPFLNDKGNPTWSQKFKTPEDVEREKRKAGDERVFQREHMLNPLTNQDRIVKEEWLKEYDVMPSFASKDYHHTFISIDPAGSKSAGADSTAMVVGSVFGYGENMRIYIHSTLINEKLGFHEIEDQAVMLAKSVGKGYPVTFIVEGVGVQSWLGDRLGRGRGLHVELFKVGSIDKETRLKFAAGWIEAGRVYLPKGMAKELRNQILNFNFTKHDDLVDAFTMLIISVMERQVKYNPFPELKKIPAIIKGEEISFQMNRDIWHDNRKPITAGLRKMIF